MILRLVLVTLATLIVENSGEEIIRRDLSLKTLSRAKRFAVFPEGSTWSIAICSMTQAIVPDNNGIWTEAINWGISYDLPNETSTFQYFLFPFRATPEETQRRSRRDLYARVETILDSVGFDGRQCILRSICEASQRYSRAFNSNSLLDEILKRIFTFLGTLTRSEPDEHRHYHRAYRIGHADEYNCADEFPCPVSLIELATSDFFRTSHEP